MSHSRFFDPRPHAEVERAPIALQQLERVEVARAGVRIPRRDHAAFDALDDPYDRCSDPNGPIEPVVLLVLPAAVDVEQHAEPARIDAHLRLGLDPLERCGRHDRHRLALNLPRVVELHQTNATARELGQRRGPRTIDDMPVDESAVVIEADARAGADIAEDLETVWQTHRERFVAWVVLGRERARPRVLRAP
jgi:hypothetical protein